MPSKRTKFYSDAPIELLPLILEGDRQLNGLTSNGEYSIAQEKDLRHKAIQTVSKLESLLNKPKSSYLDLKTLFLCVQTDIQALITASETRNIHRDRGASVSVCADRSTDVENLNPHQPATEQGGVHHGA